MSQLVCQPVVVGRWMDEWLGFVRRQWKISQHKSNRVRRLEGLHNSEWRAEVEADKKERHRGSRAAPVPFQFPVGAKFRRPHFRLAGTPSGVRFRCRVLPAHARLSKLVARN